MSVFPPPWSVYGLDILNILFLLVKRSLFHLGSLGRVVIILGVAHLSACSPGVGASL